MSRKWWFVVGFVALYAVAANEMFRLVSTPPWLAVPVLLAGCCLYLAAVAISAVKVGNLCALQDDPFWMVITTIVFSIVALAAVTVGFALWPGIVFVATSHGEPYPGLVFLAAPYLAAVTILVGIVSSIRFRRRQ